MRLAGKKLPRQSSRFLAGFSAIRPCFVTLLDIPMTELPFCRICFIVSEVLPYAEIAQPIRL
jgi:hypothetical protein